MFLHITDIKKCRSAEHGCSLENSNCLTLNILHQLLILCYTQFKLIDIKITKIQRVNPTIYNIIKKKTIHGYTGFMCKLEWKNKSEDISERMQN